jgi:4-alpha-glucanotransferase
LTLLLQDWLALSPRYYTCKAEEETINDPTNPHHYWRYRMQPHVEDLLQDHELLVMLQNKNLLSGRAYADEVGMADGDMQDGD